MAHDYKTIIVSDADRIRRITLNRPQFLNAYRQTLGQSAGALAAAAVPPHPGGALA